MTQDEFEFAFKKVMVMLCREQRIEMFVKVDLDCRCFDVLPTQRGFARV